MVEGICMLFYVLTAKMARVIFDTRVGPLVLCQILLTQERFIALRTLEGSRSHFVRLLMRLERVFRSERLSAHLANVRPNSGVRIDVFVQEILRTIHAKKNLIIYLK